LDIDFVALLLFLLLLLLFLELHSARCAYWQGGARFDRQPMQFLELQRLRVSSFRHPRSAILAALLSTRCSLLTVVVGAA